MIKVLSSFYPTNETDTATAKFITGLAIDTTKDGTPTVREFSSGDELKETVQAGGLSLGEGLTPEIVGDKVLQHFMLLDNSGNRVGEICVASDLIRRKIESLC